MAKYLVGIDIGTTSSQGVLVDLEGRIVTEHTIEHGVERPRPGWAEHDAEQIWWNEFVIICRALLEKSRIDAGQIAGIGCSALYPVLLPVDHSGRPLRPAILYGIDTRAVDEITELNSTLGESYALEVGGNVLSAQSIAPKILWLRRAEPDVFQNTYKFINATGFLIHRLTGVFVMDHNSASLGGLPYSMRSRGWDEQAIKACGITIDRLPTLRESTEIAGYVTPQAAAATGLKAGTPVSAGAGDFGAEMLSIGAYKPNQAIVSYGTTFSIAACTDSPFSPHPNLMFQCHPLPGRNIIGGGMATGAALTKWFRDNFGETELAEQRSTGVNAYQLLSRAAEQAPAGSEGLIVLPYFSGERCPIFDPAARGLVLGLTLRHKKHHFYRALLEGVAYSVRHVKEILEDFDVELKDVSAVGGGTKSEILTQIVSDVIQREQNVLEESLGSPFGAGFLAGLATGAIDDYNKIRDWIRIERKVIPSQANAQVYDKLFHIYLKLYDDCKEHMHALTRLNRADSR